MLIVRKSIKFIQFGLISTIIKRKQFYLNILLQQHMQQTLITTTTVMSNN